MFGVGSKGGWICKCGNENYSDRMVCNLRKCGLPRDGGVGAAPAGAPRGANGFPEGPNWFCKCGNENFPSRAVCNLKKCGLPRVQGQVGAASFGGNPYRMSPTIGGFPTFAPVPMQPSFAPRSGPEAEPGSWVCRCGNENYPSRASCNMKKCGLSREQGEVGKRPVGRMPAGSAIANWFCKCGNENFPSRTSCNKRQCGLPREQGEVGERRPAMAFGTVGGGPVAKVPPMNCWKCSCGNINYPRRDTCNKNGCGKTRGEAEVIDVVILKQNMAAAAANMEFEEAARLKVEIEALEGPDTMSGSHRFAPY